MMDTTMHPLEAILRHCAEAAPEPWYPSIYAQANGISRDSLDPHLDQLRLAGFVRLTDWMQGRGQGYALTPEGQELLRNPRYLARLASGAPVPALEAPQEPVARPPGWQAIHERRRVLKEALTGPARPAVTLALIFLNVLWFLAGLGLTSRRNIPADAYLKGGEKVSRVWHDIGAITYEDIHQKHQWWRLLSCCFVHMGFLHLGVNMFSLYMIGPLLERMWGSWRFLFLYLISGLVGSAAMVLWAPKPFIGAGASGAIWGILGSMVAWILLNRRYLPPQLASSWLGQLLFLILLNVGITLGVPGVSKEAHFGGGLTGFFLAVPTHYSLFGRPSQRVLAFAFLAATVVLSGAWFIWRVLNPAP